MVGCTILPNPTAKRYGLGCCPSIWYSGDLHLASCTLDRKSHDHFGYVGLTWWNSILPLWQWGSDVGGKLRGIMTVATSCLKLNVYSWQSYRLDDFMPNHPIFSFWKLFWVTFPKKKVKLWGRFVSVLSSNDPQKCWGRCEEVLRIVALGCGTLLTRFQCNT